MVNMRRVWWVLIPLLFLTLLIYAVVGRCGEANKTKICEQRGHIWRTVMIYDVYVEPYYVDTDSTTLFIIPYPPVRRVCMRCGKAEEYTARPDTVVIWRIGDGKKDFGFSLAWPVFDYSYSYAGAKDRQVAYSP